MKPPQGQNWEFRDQKIPARWCHLLLNKEITSTDLLLMWIIDSLVKPENGGKGSGCYASNEYLAKAINKNPKYIARRLSYLEDRRLVVIVNYLGKRYLELETSRTLEERMAMESDYGKALRKAYNRLKSGRTQNEKQDRRAKRRFGLVDESTGLQKSNGEGLRKSNGEGLQKSNPEDSIVEDINTGELTESTVRTRCAGRDGNCGSTQSQLIPPNLPRTLHYAQARSHSNKIEFSDKGLLSGSVKPPPKKFDAIYLEWSDKLHIALAQKRGKKLPTMPRTQRFARATELKKIHDEMNQSNDLSEWIEFYCSHDIRDQAGAPLVIGGPESFRSAKIVNWLEDAISKDRDQPAPQPRHQDWYGQLTPYLGQPKPEADLLYLAKMEQVKSEIDFSLFVPWLCQELESGALTKTINDVKHLFSKAFAWIHEKFLSEQDYLLEEKEQKQAMAQKAQQQKAKNTTRKQKIIELGLEVGDRVVYKDQPAEILKIDPRNGKLFVSTSEDILWISPLSIELAKESV